MTQCIVPIVRAGDVDALVKAIESKKYNLNAIDDDGYTALYVACMKAATTPMIPHLIVGGAQPDVKGSDKETPLYIACFNGNLEAAQRLLQGKANVNETNGADKDTALHAAAKFGFVDVVELLIASNANLNFRNARQETPLFYAAKAGRVEVTYRLLEAGANRTLMNNESKDALFIASEKGHKGVVELLKTEKQYLANVRASVLIDERNKPAPIRPTSALLEKPAPPKAKDGDAKKKEDEKPAAANRGPSPKPPAKPAPAKKTAQSPARKATEAAAAKSPPVKPRAKTPEEEVVYEATPVIPIEVPKPEQRTHDPLTGKKIKVEACKTMLEAGIPEPAPIPAEAVKDFPELRASYGGTSMAVGSGTEEKIVQRPLFQPEDGDVFMNVTLPGDRRPSVSKTGRSPPPAAAAAA
uniref:Ankyrin repeat protein n=1 Tax=Neobodo designis TaxID=312471 RepID=A0A7S1MDK6_NEODS|mmetsp:Transcript_38460/g.118883  ORF Transcript_38460/g.118883 Transcript_38460/m.118883 type:complete len:412 (+) Transcript_38460:85-1320(+)